ncbi:MAG: helix-turn-helix domain-containing protein [Planctomycetaceae bacterium]
MFTPDAILRWHRELITSKCNYSANNNSIGRRRIRAEIVELILRFVKENPTWGADRIQGALANVGYHIKETTVRNALKATDLEPAPD